MRVRSRGTVLIALVTAAVLVAISAAALLDTRNRVERSPGLAGEFGRIDATYQAATRQFVDQTQGLDDADLRTALRLYGLVLDAAQDARAAVAELDDVEETRRPTERMERALRVQEMALERAIEAARTRDETGAQEASQQFQTAVLAYMAARQEMVAALAACGSRCR